jgi:arginyl-tRNA synthetase
LEYPSIRYAGESFYSDKMGRVVNYAEGCQSAEESEGAQIVDLEAYGMSPALITKRDGSSLYITRDIAAAIYRKEHYDFYKNLYIVASQQNLHFQQWIQIIELLGFEWARDCVHIPFGLVSLEEGTMSTRHGRVVFLKGSDEGGQPDERDHPEKTQHGQLDVTARRWGSDRYFPGAVQHRIKDYVFSWTRC